MFQPVIYIDHSRVREGKLDELKKGMSELAKFVEENEPQLVAYHVYFNEEGSGMTVLHVNPDSASLELHMTVAGPEFPKVADYITLQTIDVYGAVSDDLVEQLSRKARMLGNGIVRIHGLHAGFARLPGLNAE